MKVLKFLLAIAILFVTAMYYNVFSFDRGFVQSTKDKDESLLLTIKEIESVKLGDTYYVFYLADDDAYLEKIDEDDYKIIDAFIEIDEKSIVPGVIGIVGAVVVLIFVGNKKK